MPPSVTFPLRMSSAAGIVRMKSRAMVKKSREKWPPAKFTMLRTAAMAAMRMQTMRANRRMARWERGSAFE